MPSSFRSGLRSFIISALGANKIINTRRREDEKKREASGRFGRRRRALCTCKVEDRRPLLLLFFFFFFFILFLFCVSLPFFSPPGPPFTPPYNASACITYNSVISPGSFLTWMPREHAHSRARRRQVRACIRAHAHRSAQDLGGSCEAKGCEAEEGACGNLAQKFRSPPRD